LSKYAAEEFGFRMPVSYTTRPLRKNEVDGVDYRHIPTEEFLKMRKAGDFAESAEVYGYHYATSKLELESCLFVGDTLLEIDHQGAGQIKGDYPEATVVQILPRDRKQLREQLEKRGTDSPEVIDRRLAKALVEIESIRADAFIVNDDLDTAKEELKELIADLKEIGSLSLLKYQNPLAWQKALSALRA
jgi:guanylate kinase